MIPSTPHGFLLLFLASVVACAGWVFTAWLLGKILK